MDTQVIVNVSVNDIDVGSNSDDHYLPLSQLDIDPEALLSLSHVHNAGRRAKDFPSIDMSAIADELGCNKSHVSRIFRGQRMPSFKLGHKLCVLLKITPEQLERMCSRKVNANASNIAV